MKEKNSPLVVIEKVFICFCLFSMLILILIATAARITGIASITWGEEAARYLMIWLAMISISIGFKTDSHLGLSFFVDRFKGNTKVIVLGIRALIITAFLLLIVVNGTRVIMMQFSFVQYSPSLRIPMYLIYGSIPVGFTLSTIRFVVCAVNEIRSLVKGDQKQAD